MQVIVGHAAVMVQSMVESVVLVTVPVCVGHVAVVANVVVALLVVSVEQRHAVLVAVPVHALHVARRVHVPVLKTDALPVVLAAHVQHVAAAVLSRKS